MAIWRLPALISLAASAHQAMAAEGGTSLVRGAPGRPLPRGEPGEVVACERCGEAGDFPGDASPLRFIFLKSPVRAEDTARKRRSNSLSLYLVWAVYPRTCGGVEGDVRTSGFNVAVP